METIADIITGILLEPPSTNGVTTPEVFSAWQPTKMQSQLHDLEEILFDERADFKRAIAMLEEEMVDRNSFL